MMHKKELLQENLLFRQKISRLEEVVDSLENQQMLFDSHKSDHHFKKISSATSERNFNIVTIERSKNDTIERSNTLNITEKLDRLRIPKLTFDIKEEDSMELTTSRGFSQLKMLLDLGNKNLNLVKSGLESFTRNKD